ncbi:MAG: hypothetical protein HOV77_06180 [Hamadaea sp.]|uniref:hypothetical protein n=1 Tax=Hamadaea sp. TaxID=2024425 RepID=UPI0018539256|nr:hypothetical protein [Hamadaea sp.]NUT18754.1 hypothetical protein [Hamadaea sp.]
MTFALGIFELFTYAIPGAMQLAVLLYLAVRLDLVDWSQITSASGVLQLAAVLIASYLLGHTTYVVSGLVDRVTTFGFRKDASDAWEKVAGAAQRAGAPAVPRMDVMLLLARIQLSHLDAAAEISRFRATGLMLRSAVVPMAAATTVAMVESIAGPRHLLAMTCTVLSAFIAIGFAWYGQKMRFWANTKTFEFACWTGVAHPPGESGQPLDGKSAAA